MRLFSLFLLSNVATLFFDSMNGAATNIRRNIRFHNRNDNIRFLDESSNFGIDTLVPEPNDEQEDLEGIDKESNSKKGDEDDNIENDNENGDTDIEEGTNVDEEEQQVNEYGDEGNFLDEDLGNDPMGKNYPSENEGPEEDISSDVDNVLGGDAAGSDQSNIDPVSESEGEDEDISTDIDVEPGGVSGEGIEPVDSPIASPFDSSIDSQMNSPIDSSFDSPVDAPVFSPVSSINDKPDNAPVYSLIDSSLDSQMESPVDSSEEDQAGEDDIQTATFPGLNNNITESPSGSIEIDDTDNPVSTRTQAPTYLPTGWNEHTWPEPTLDFPTTEYIKPTFRPTVAYISVDDDPIKNDVLNEDDMDSSEGWVWNNETVEEMEHDKTVIIALSTVFGGMFFFSIFVAYQLLENPDGCCASLCRISVACVCGFLRCICYPCRAICGCTGQPKARHSMISSDDGHFTHDLELS